MINKVPNQFEWDSKKNEANSEKHGIAFEDAIDIFDAPFLKYPSDRSSETRSVAI
jgi:uncharacterized DUF497 family protein